MEYSVEDYYSILGLDPGVSEESIKVVYRRLAREHHPDGKVDSTESERERFSAQMAQLNRAYAVLSDAKLRREYDQKLKILGSLQSSNTMSRATNTVSNPKSRERVAPHDDLDLVVARELSRQLRANLLAHHKGISWKEKDLEGFDWGLEGSSWSSHFCVAGLGFGVLNLASAKKFTKYSTDIIARCNRSVRKSHFLFLLPFQRLSEWEAVAAEFNRFFSAESHTKFCNVPVEIALLDARQGRTTRFGGQSREKLLDELLQCVSATS
jgi:curved DNA-binding protein CbpA